jgi:hypothetical protein
MEGLIATLIALPSRKLQTPLGALLATFRLVNGLDRSHSSSIESHRTGKSRSIKVMGLKIRSAEALGFPVKSRCVKLARLDLEQQYPSLSLYPAGDFSAGRLPFQEALGRIAFAAVVPPSPSFDVYWQLPSPDSHVPLNGSRR